MQAVGWLLIVTAIACLAVAPAFPPVRRLLGLPEDSVEAAAVRKFLRSPLRGVRAIGTESDRGGAWLEVGPNQLPELKYPRQVVELVEHAGSASAETRLEGLRRKLSACAAAGDLQGEASVLNRIGFVLERHGDFEQARREHERALILFEEAEEPVGVGDSLNNLGVVLARMGETGEAESCHFKALQVRERIGGARVANSMNNLGVLFARSQPGKAKEYLEEGERLALEAGDKRGLGKFINNRAVLEAEAMDSGDGLARLREAFEKALALRDASEDQRGHAKTQNNLGIVCALSGEYEKAERHYAAAAALARGVEDRVSLLHILQNWLTQVREHGGKPGPAERIAGELAGLAGEVDFPRATVLMADCEAYPLELGPLGEVALLSSGSTTPASPVEGGAQEREAGPAI